MKYLFAAVAAILALSIQAAANANAASMNVEVLRPWQIKALSGPDQLVYYQAVQNIVNQIESQIGDKPRHAHLQTLIVQEAFAESRTGDPCEAGGYFSLWVRTENGLVCSPQNDDPNSGLGVNEKFDCDAGKAFCNDAVYLYGSDSGQRFCEPAQNLSANCAKDFSQRYGRVGDPHFPNLLISDGKRFASSKSPADHEKNAQLFEASLNSLLKENQIDPKAADEIRKSLGVVTGLRDKVASINDAKLNANGTQKSDPAEQQARVQTESAPLPTGGYSTGGSAPSSAPSNADPGPSQAASPAAPLGTGGGTGGGASTAQTTPAAATAVPSKLLGKELTCVRDGLAKMGYAPSERYLALLGVGAQATNGAYNTNQDAARETMQSRVISMVQAYGFCDEKSYPAKKLKAADVALVRRWLTADGGKAQLRRGMEFYRQMMDPTSQALTARKFYDIFGMRQATPRSTDPRAFDQSVEHSFWQMFTPTEGNWAKESLAQRQAHANAINGLDPNGEFSKCNANAQALRKSDGAFHLGDLGGRGARRSVARQIAATNGLCASMASSCRLNIANTCTGTAAPAQGVPLAPLGSGPKTQ